MSRRQEVTATVDRFDVRIRNVRREQLCNSHHCRMALCAADYECWSLDPTIVCERRGERGARRPVTDIIRRCGNDIIAHLSWKGVERPCTAVKIDDMACCVRFACLELGQIDLRRGAEHGKKSLFSCRPQDGEWIRFEQRHAFR